MSGMNAITGRSIAGTAHLMQSIADILTTPLGSRIQRRDYGSLLPDLIDQPFNERTRLQLFGAIATALMRWERRIRLSRIALTPASAPGAFVLELDYRPSDGRPATSLTVPLRFPTF
ncbi:GPW/gp25 family protein [Stenotrophomonas sp. B1-1]|uniref:GPW/gp25 family protein n=1 Tax=Stenotrophomonas sp. B1-1 TaxID=2710648 RepID=UPI0013DCC1B2|nr:GPW/gp25 family protein [Stenotrophomonas sp. B1-1]